MVNSLARIGLLPNSANENRKLAVDMAELIINWEKQRLSEANESPNKGATTDGDNNNNTTTVKSEPTATPTTASTPMEIEGQQQDKTESATAGNTTTPAGPSVTTPPASSATANAANNNNNNAASSDFKTSTTISEMIVNFLIRIASTQNDATATPISTAPPSATPASHQPHDSSSTSSTTATATSTTATNANISLPARSLELLKEAVTLWPDAYIKFVYFEKLLAPAIDQPSIVCTGLGILNAVLDYQLNKFVVDNIAQLQQALTPSMTSSDPRVSRNDASIYFYYEV